MYWEEHQLVHERKGAVLDRPTWEWAERDRNRVVYASGGKILASGLGVDGPERERELIDLNADTFQRVEAPYPGIQTR